MHDCFTLNFSGFMEPEKTSLFAVALQDSTRIIQQDAELKDQIDVVFKRKYAAEVSQLWITVADAAPAVVGFLCNIVIYQTDALPQPINGAYDWRWVP